MMRNGQDFFLFQKVKNSELDQTDGSSVKDDPVVGWLVVVDGYPGKGNYVHLGFGMNGIGRNETNRIQLDFGTTKSLEKIMPYLRTIPKVKSISFNMGAERILLI